MLSHKSHFYVSYLVSHHIIVARLHPPRPRLLPPFPPLHFFVRSLSPKQSNYGKVLDPPPTSPGRRDVKVEAASPFPIFAPVSFLRVTWSHTPFLTPQLIGQRPPPTHTANPRRCPPGRAAAAFFPGAAAAALVSEAARPSRRRALSGAACAAQPHRVETAAGAAKTQNWVVRTEPYRRMPAFGCCHVQRTSVTWDAQAVPKI